MREDTEEINDLSVAALVAAWIEIAKLAAIKHWLPCRRPCGGVD